MPIITASLLCHATAGLVAVLIAGGLKGWWSPLPGELAAGLLLTSCLVGTGLLIARRRTAEAPHLTVPASHPVAQRHGVPVLQRIERRAYPRFTVDWPAAVQWRGVEPRPGRLHDISRGGAFLSGTEQRPVGTEGVLRIEGITVPVPCRVVGIGSGGGMHIAFTIEGLGLDALLAQLHAKLETIGG
jgi:hypothetical protein